ncbi:D-2-hydroxyacid dehydrogenase family protein [Roseomonas haemaphysalidis]|uniref:D-2-hydroxyacid dehydrogenase family protein n=1 Tax=Roseomonas haemaphysalidis TaxID=2768162 RepID=A0ABS3KLZ3_9PROT|nr:D-2-hydroxyacid dehydrogenase family protein [Roseomonas haemaphysalidis]MBO1077975.1 D-2-hydroxyacid dehydrogenase family protein [Roseomonas haemaphysalidis]
MNGRPPLRRIVVLDDYGDAAGAAVDWRDLPVEILRDKLAPDALVARLRDADAVVLIRERSAMPEALLARLPALRLVVTAGMRNRVLDLEACDARGIAACGTESSASPTVELCWGLILGLARRIPQQERLLRAGGWQQGAGLGLEGATLGIAGLGRIGAGVAAIGRAFNMRLLAWSPNMTADTAAAAGAELVSKAGLFAGSDIVTLHLGLGPATRGIVGAAELGAMRPGALLVNTARGPLVDEAALLAALRDGPLGGAAIDTHEPEPLPLGAPILDAPGTLLTPHLGYVTQQNFRHYFEGATACLRAWNSGAPLPRPLNAAARDNQGHTA